MPKPLKSERIVDIPLKSWSDIGDFVGNEVRRLVRDKKVLGGSYNPEYAELKQSRSAAPRGVPQASTSTKPDLTLTGKMLDDLRREKVSKNQVSLSMLRYNVEKMKGNIKRGWDMLDNTKVLKPIRNNVNKRIGKQFDKNINKWSKDDIFITIG
tara:strand:- start:298 stop:759 length:462 start_codon:yes stop_codon:yes gene_type:complete